MDVDATGCSARAVWWWWARAPSVTGLECSALGRSRVVRLVMLWAACFLKYRLSRPGRLLAGG
jgi:hypothetical protein